MPVRIVGVACGYGAPDPRCAEGPDALRRQGLVSRLQRAAVDAAWSATISKSPGEDPYIAVASVAGRLARSTEEIAARGRFPVVLGGDHSCAIGTWKGIARATSARGPLGLIWIDAHMDAHTPATTPSGKLHGMPLACLLGQGDPRLTAIAGSARLDPRRVCLIGVRSFETGEAALLTRLGVRVFFMHEVRRRGLAAVMKEAVAIARGKDGCYGISLDLDAIDPRDAPGVGSPVPGGIRSRELWHALAACRRDPALAALEIVEYNPYRDRRGATARLVEDAIEARLAPSVLAVTRGGRAANEKSCARKRDGRFGGGTRSVFAKAA
jgi:arginase